MSKCGGTTELSGLVSDTRPGREGSSRGCGTLS